MSLVIKFYFTSSMLNMFRTLIYPSSGACDFSIVSPHWLCVLVSMCVGVSVWLVGVVSALKASTCFGHYYAHHQELATMMLITTLVVSFLVCCSWRLGAVRLESCLSLQPGHYSSLTAPDLQPTANQERNDQCGNQHHSRELLMMGIVVPEICWTCKKYNKIISGI